jgi:4-hydroxyacetophenone monooxygenase
VADLTVEERRDLVDATEIRERLTHAHPNVMRAVVYVLTGDPRLAQMRTIELERRGGAFIEHTLSEADAKTVSDIAVDYLASREPGADAESPVDIDRTRVEDAMGFLMGGRPNPAEYRLGARELRMESVCGIGSSRPAWSGVQPPDLSNWRVLVVGTGFSGIGTAVRLQQLGIPYSVVDMQPRIGGTWERNQFPEARVDTTSYVYQFSFVERYPWSQHYAPQEQVRKYLEHVASTYGVTPNIRLSTQVIESRFDAATGLWEVLMQDGEGRQWHEQANFIVSASGLFSTPKRPDFEGVDVFGGPMVHSAQWDPDFDPTGKRVGIIGNGSTGVQILPWLAENADEVKVFLRTPQWISPLEKYKEPVAQELQWLHDTIPLYWRWSCYNARLIRGTLGDAQEYDWAWQARGGLISRRNDGLRENLTQYIATKLGHDPELQRLCTPDYAPLARRLVVDNGWYDAIVRDNVSVETSGIARLHEGAIETGDGERIECDAIVLATGFDAEKYTLPATYHSDAGTLEQVWEKDGPRAYGGVEVPGFPNLYIMYGPNGQPRGGSLVAALELWIDHVARVIVKTIESGRRWAVVSDEAFENYNRCMDEEMAKLIWQDAAPRERNYYVNSFGRQNVNMPWRLHDYAQIMWQDLENTHVFG